MKTHYPTTLHNNAGTLCTGEPASRLAAVCHSRWNGDTPADHPQTVANAARLDACWNACHGLDLPPDITPGAVAALVAFARMVAETAPETAGILGMFRREARAALAPFTPDPAPVSPPYAYAVKTPAGYIANQGKEWWHEAEPVGWALYSTEDHARSIALHRNGGEVVPVYRPADDISRDILNPL